MRPKIDKHRVAYVWPRETALTLVSGSSRADIEAFMRALVGAYHVKGTRTGSNPERQCRPPGGGECGLETGQSYDPNAQARVGCQHDAPSVGGSQCAPS